MEDLSKIRSQEPLGGHFLPSGIYDEHLSVAIRDSPQAYRMFIEVVADSRHGVEREAGETESEYVGRLTVRGIQAFMSEFVVHESELGKGHFIRNIHRFRAELPRGREVLPEARGFEGAETVLYESLRAARDERLPAELAHGNSVPGFMRMADRWSAIQVGVRAQGIVKVEDMSPGAVSGGLTKFREYIKSGLGVAGLSDPTGRQGVDRALPAETEWKIARMFAEGVDRQEIMDGLNIGSPETISRAVKKTMVYLTANTDSDGLNDALRTRRERERMPNMVVPSSVVEPMPIVAPTPIIELVPIIESADVIEEDGLFPQSIFNAKSYKATMQGSDQAYVLYDSITSKARNEALQSDEGMQRRLGYIAFVGVRAVMEQISLDESDAGKSRIAENIQKFKQDIYDSQRNVITVTNFEEARKFVEFLIGEAAANVQAVRCSPSVADERFTARVDRWFAMLIGMQPRSIAAFQGISQAAISISNAALRSEIKIGLGVIEPPENVKKVPTLLSDREWAVATAMVSGADRQQLMQQMGITASTYVSRCVTKARAFLITHPDYKHALRDMLLKTTE